MNEKIEALDMLNAQKDRLQWVYEYYVASIDGKDGSYKTERLSVLAEEVFGFSKTTLAKCLRKLVKLGLLNKEGKHLATYTLPDNECTIDGCVHELVPVGDSEIDDMGHVAGGTIDASVAPVGIETSDDVDVRIGGLAQSVHELTNLVGQMSGKFANNMIELSKRIDEIAEVDVIQKLSQELQSVAAIVIGIQKYTEEQKAVAEIDATEKERLKLVNVLGGLLSGLDTMSGYKIEHDEKFRDEFGYPVEQMPIGEYPEAEKWVYSLIKGYKE